MNSIEVLDGDLEIPDNQLENLQSYLLCVNIIHCVVKVQPIWATGMSVKQITTDMIISASCCHQLWHSLSVFNTPMPKEGVKTTPSCGLLGIIFFSFADTTNICCLSVPKHQRHFLIPTPPYFYFWFRWRTPWH